MNTSNDDITGTAQFCYEVGLLKNLPRSGWQRANVSARIESVGEHSHRVSVIALVLAHMEGLDAAGAEHAMALGAIHDLPETRIGDLGHVAKRYSSVAAPDRVAADQVAGLPAGIAEHIVGLVREHESAKTGGTLAALCSRDADKLDCLLQARSYEQGGNQVVWRWVEDMLADLRTESGHALAAAARDMDPADWWTNLSTHASANQAAG